MNIKKKLSHKNYLIMTQEQKAKAYDEALKVIKGNLDALNEITETGAEIVNIQSIKNCFYRVFPELKDSEDEKIRKAIIETLPKYGYLSQTSIKVKDAIAWLEKQGKQEEPQVYKTMDGETITYSETDGYKVCDEKQKEQEQLDVNFKVKERKWVHDAVDNVFPEDGDFMSEVDFRKIIKDTALYFYRLGLNARKEI